MPLTYTRPVGAALVGAVNEVSALWRDGKVAATSDAAELQSRQKLYVALVGAMIVGLPLWASMEGGGIYAEVGEGAFDSLVALVARNTMAATIREGAVPAHTPL